MGADMGWRILPQWRPALGAGIREADDGVFNAVFAKGRPSVQAWPIVPRGRNAPPPRTRPVPPKPYRSHWLEYLQAGGAIGAGLVGLTAYVYLLGGIVAWLRITAARLSSDNATSAFQDRALLATGLKALLFELFLLGAISLVVWLAWRAARHIDSQARKDQAHLVQYVAFVLLASLVAGLTTAALLVEAFDVDVDDKAGAIILCFLGVGLLLGGLDLTERVPHWLYRERREHSWIGPALWVLRLFVTTLVTVTALIFMAVPLAITTLVLLALLHLGSRIDLLPQARGMRDLLPAVAILAAALNAVIIPYLATPPVTFDRATVLTQKDEEIVGAFIGRSNEGVYLATCNQQRPTVSKEARIKLIPAEEVKAVVLGGFPYSFDVGRRPSLLALTKYFVDGSPLSHDDDGFQLDLRGERHVCGIKGPG
jgi:hypothetical protein